MLLRPGKTYDQAIKLLDGLAQGGLNNVENAIPHIGSASFSQLMTPAVLSYQRWTESAQREFREIFADSSIIDRLRGEQYWHRLGSFNWPSPGSSRSSTMRVAATPQAGVRGTGRHPARQGRSAQPHRCRARPSRRAKPPRAYLMSLVAGWTARTNRRSPAPHPPRRPPRPGSGLRGFQPVPPCWHSQDARGRRPAPPEPRRPPGRPRRSPPARFPAGPGPVC